MGRETQASSSRLLVPGQPVLPAAFHRVLLRPEWGGEPGHAELMPGPGPSQQPFNSWQAAVPWSTVEGDLAELWLQPGDWGRRVLHSLLVF